MNQNANYKLIVTDREGFYTINNMIHHHYLLCLGTTLECRLTDILGENALNEKGTKKHARAKHNGLMLLLAGHRKQDIFRFKRL